MRTAKVRLSLAEIDGIDRLISPEMNKTEERIVELRVRQGGENGREKEADERAIEVLEFHLNRLASASLSLDMAWNKIKQRERKWNKFKSLFSRKRVEHDGTEE